MVHKRQRRQVRDSQQGMWSWKFTYECMEIRSSELRDINGSISDPSSLENFLGSDAPIYSFCLYLYLKAFTVCSNPSAKMFTRKTAS